MQGWKLKEQSAGKLFFLHEMLKKSSQVWLTLSTLQRKGLLNSSGGAVFTCYLMAKGSCVHGQEKTDLYVSFSVFFFPFVHTGGCPCAQEGFLT